MIILKKSFALLLILIIFLILFKKLGDKALIKFHMSVNTSPFSKAMNTDMRYLGKVEGYRIYYVESHRKPYLGDKDTIDGYFFESKLFSTIKGIKHLGYYTLGELLFEENINSKKLYEAIPEKYK